MHVLREIVWSSEEGAVLICLFQSLEGFAHTLNQFDRLE